MKNVRDVIIKIEAIKEVNEEMFCAIQNLRKDIDDPNWYGSNISSVSHNEELNCIHVELDDDEIYRKNKEFDKIEEVFVKAYMYLEEYSEYLKSIPIIDYIQH